MDKETPGLCGRPVTVGRRFSCTLGQSVPGDVRATRVAEAVVERRIIPSDRSGYSETRCGPSHRDRAAASSGAPRGGKRGGVFEAREDGAEGWSSLLNEEGQTG